MHLSIFATICALAATTAMAAATPACHEDNCLRAVQASAFPQHHGAADCAAYLQMTVTSADVTTTTTVTTLSISRTTLFLDKRQATATPATIPAYASACSGAARYSSACACIGVTGSITTAPVATDTATVTTTTVVTEEFIIIN